MEELVLVMIGARVDIVYQTNAVIAQRLDKQQVVQVVSFV